MRSVLLPVEDFPETETNFAVAAQLAARFGSIIDGVALRPVQFQVVGAEPIVAVSFPASTEDESEVLANARKRFEKFSASRGQADNLRMRWRSGTTIDDNGLGSLARVYDITVVGRPSSSGNGPRMTTLESVLFDSGRPALIAPPKALPTFGDNVVISWNCSSESARTVDFAKPLILGAKQVTVLTVLGSTVPGPSGADLVEYLATHGVKAKEVTVPADDRKPGIAILEEAGRLGADLLVKGAYTQSRLRQMIFGGATSQILAATGLPVVMAN